MPRVVLMAVLVTAMGSASRAAERLVSDAGALAAAVRAAGPGDVVTLRDGVWNDVDLVLEAAGTVDRPVTVRAQTSGNVIVGGRSQLRISGTGLVVEGLWFRDGAPAGSHAIAFRTASDRLARHCRLTRCALTDFNPAGKQVDTRWVSL